MKFWICIFAGIVVSYYFDLPFWVAAALLSAGVAYNAYTKTGRSVLSPAEHAQKLRLEAAAVALWRDVGDSPCQNGTKIFAVVRDRWSVEAAEFFLFRCMLGVCYPGPDLDIWVRFGFCACRDESEERLLANMYAVLAGCCTYEEFFTAYCTSTIVELLDTRGLGHHRAFHPYLEDVLSTSPHIFKSVWHLKQYVQDPTAGRSIILLSVAMDYGFINCTSEDEYQELQGAYKTIFERPDASPLQLHKACTSGSLYQYVAGLIPDLKRRKKNKQKSRKFQRLLQNRGNVVYVI